MRVLVQPSFLGTDNRFLLDAIRARPRRLRGVAVVDPEAGDDALQALADSGICGIRLNLVGLPIPDFSRARLAAPVRARARARLACRAAPRRPGAGPAPGSRCSMPAASWWSTISAARAAARRRRPGLAAGRGRRRPDLGQALGRLPQLARCPGRPQARAAADRLLRAFGAERLLWGSDWPHTQHRDRVDYTAARAALADWVPDAAARQRDPGRHAGPALRIRTTWRPSCAMTSRARAGWPAPPPAPSCCCAALAVQAQAQAWPSQADQAGRDLPARRHGRRGGAHRRARRCRAVSASRWWSTTAAAPAARSAATWWPRARPTATR